MIKVAACLALWPLVTDPRLRRESGRPEAWGRSAYRPRLRHL